MSAEPNAVSSYKIFLLLTLLLPQTVWARSSSAIEAFNEGVKYFNAKQFNEAIPRFDAAISHDADFADAYFARGACRYYLKSMDGALLDLNSAARLKPNYTDALALRGSVNYELDHWDEALEDFNSVLKKYPKDAQSLLGRGVIFLKREDFETAARDFRGFLRVRPDDPVAPKVREILGSMKQVSAEPSSEENAAKSPAQAAAPGHRISGGSSQKDLNNLADGLFHNPLSESYGRQVIRGENVQAVGDIHKASNIPQKPSDSDSGVEIVEPQ